MTSTIETAEHHPAAAPVVAGTASETGVAPAAGTAREAELAPAAVVAGTAREAGTTPAADGASAEPTLPRLPRPPDEVGVVGFLSRMSRTAFRYANRSTMVPFHRAGLAAWLGNPLTGWQLLLTTTGRKSGLRRPTPLGYLVEHGAAWVLAGYGPSTLWYRNLIADPRVEVLLPARPPFAAQATDVVNPAVRARIIPRLVRSMALPGMLIGDLPWRASDERILELTAWVPLIRLAPVDGSTLVAGPDDPGGLGWTWRTVVTTLATAVAWRALRSRRPR